MNNKNKRIKVIDLFCGAGGLTHGLVKSGLDVVAGIDNDPQCEYPYSANNPSKFILKDIKDVSGAELIKLYKNADIKVLVGCAPCQPFSRLNQYKNSKKTMEQPLMKFAKLIDQVLPEIVSMENVRGLEKKDIFDYFIKLLKSNGYHVSYKIINASHYGVPQNRRRLVLLASRLGSIKHISPTEDKVLTVRKAIGSLPRIKDGQKHKLDHLHRSRKLSSLNKARILATPNDGGDSRSWPKHLVLACHARKSGKTFKINVYGRMKWDLPSPTLTTQCVGFGNGRFGHPEQNRAISLREASLLQSFPKNYKFIKDSEYSTSDIARIIGNAVPVKLGEAIGLSIKEHLKIKQYG